MSTCTARTLGEAVRSDIRSLLGRRAEKAPWMLGECEPPLGTKMVQGDLKHAFTEEQQKRLGVDSDGFPVRTASEVDSLYGPGGEAYGEGGGPSYMAAPKRARTATGTFVIGGRVRAHSLKGNGAALNGEAGRIVAVKVTAKGERWTVEFDTHQHGKKALKPDNLRNIYTAPPAHLHGAPDPAPENPADDDAPAPEDAGGAPTIVAAPLPPVGSAVEAHGLVGMPYLNGERGVVADHREDPRSGQTLLLVQFEGTQDGKPLGILAIRAVNLRPAPGEADSDPDVEDVEETEQQPPAAPPDTLREKPPQDPRGRLAGGEVGRLTFAARAKLMAQQAAAAGQPPGASAGHDPVASIRLQPPHNLPPGVDPGRVGAMGVEEYRKDVSDGQAYPLRGFILAYGGSAQSPPAQWLNAAPVESDKLDFAGTGKKSAAHQAAALPTVDDIIGCKTFEDALVLHPRVMYEVLTDGPPIEVFKEHWTPGAQYHEGLRNRIAETLEMPPFAPGPAPQTMPEPVPEPPVCQPVPGAPVSA